MAVSEEALKRLINGNTKKLCGNNKIVENTAQRSNFYNGDGFVDNGSDEYESLFDDPMFNLPPSSGVRSNSGDINYSGNAEKSNMPQFIKESMIQNRINVEGMDNVSVAAEQNFKNLSRSKELMYENTSPKKAANGVGISKEQFMSWMDEYFNSHDNALKTITLKGGLINLVDNSGNIYVAKLKKVENKI